MTPDTLTVFVNEVAVRVAPGTVAADAVRALQDQTLAEALGAGRAYLTDGSGIRIDPASPVHAGAIVRVVLSARRAAESDADA